MSKGLHIVIEAPPQIVPKRRVRIQFRFVAVRKKKPP